MSSILGVAEGTSLATRQDGTHETGLDEHTHQATGANLGPIVNVLQRANEADAQEQQEQCYGNPPIMKKRRSS